MTHKKLDTVGADLAHIMTLLDRAKKDLDIIYKGYEPGYPYADSPDARAWDYYSAIHDAANEIAKRLNTWDDGDYPEHY